jgi:hypothetical protein
MVLISAGIPSNISERTRSIYEAIAEHLDALGYEVAGGTRVFADAEDIEYNGDLHGSLGAVYYEGMDFGHLFSMDYAYYRGDYGPYEDMNETLRGVTAYHEQCYAKAVIYPI